MNFEPVTQECRDEARSNARVSAVIIALLTLISILVWILGPVVLLVIGGLFIVSVVCAMATCTLINGWFAPVKEDSKTLSEELKGE